MKVIVAGQAGITVLGHDKWFYDQTPTILIYPNEYTARDVARPSAGGFTLVGDEDRLGEASYRGPIILSWPEVIAGGQDSNGGHNLVIHEFAHHLDMINGRFADGKPPMPSAQIDRAWDRITDTEFARLQQNCAQGQRSILSCYGTTNRAEFFAVSSEVFFQRPSTMRVHLGQWYDMMKQVYQVDPEQWL
jgi:hypothetical protein